MIDSPIIATIAGAFLFAWILGLLTQKIGLSPIVGYLLAGVVISPNTPGFSGDVSVARQLADIGVILLMFGVGLHLDLKQLLAIRTLAVPGSISLSLLTAGASTLLFQSSGFPTGSAAVMGVAMGVASSVVMMRMLDDSGRLSSPEGALAIGWSLVEDVLTVIFLVLVPVFSPNRGAVTDGMGLLESVSLVLVKIAALVMGVRLLGARVVPWLLAWVADFRSRELFTLTVLVVSVVFAAGTSLVFGTSMALGAFLAGIVVAQSPSSHQVAADALPLRDAFSVVFFVAAGMLFDPAAIMASPWALLAAMFVVLLLKPVAAIVIISILRHPTRTGMVVGAGVAQIGEFSFILADVAAKEGLINPAAHNVIIGAAIVSITVNPFYFKLLPFIEPRLRRLPWLYNLLNRRAEHQALLMNRVSSEKIFDAKVTTRPKRALVIGYGPVGRSVDQMLRESGMDTVVVDLNMETVSELLRSGRSAIYGDASREHILEKAGIKTADSLVLTLPHSSDRFGLVATARAMNPGLHIFVRARYLAERAVLRQVGASSAVFEEVEASTALSRRVMLDVGVEREVMEASIRELRLNLILSHVEDLALRRIREVMVPWERVRRLSSDASRIEVLGRMAGERFSRWPVEDPVSGAVIGYLRASDLVLDGAREAPWIHLCRPIRRALPEDFLDVIVRDLRAAESTMCLVEDDGMPVGLFTLEDILERVLYTGP